MAALVLATVVATILVVRGPGDGPTTDTIRGLRPAAAPFAGLTAGTVRIGGRDWSVVVADAPSEHVQGLRGRSGPDPYDAMFFDFGGDVEARFTMAGVPAPLDVVFYDAAGTSVGRRSMVPCAGTDTTCPLYTADVPVRYAVETRPGAGPSGRLAVGAPPPGSP